MKELNVNSETIKRLDFDNDFFGFETKNKGKKNKNKQAGIHQTKKLLYGKETLQKMKRMPMG